jgi:hypothetical protein
VTLVSISTAKFEKPNLRVRTHADAGERPSLRWLSIAKLRIDQGYQREILKIGKTNVYRIAEEFDWTMFAPVIVAPIAGDLFAIIDGQHRTTAAKLCGITDVPCQVVDADGRRQAAAFAAINSRVTQISTMQIFAANVAARDPKALQLSGLCREAGVSILRYPVPHNKIKAGQTMAVTCLERAMQRYPHGVLVKALSCITKTRDGNPGMLRIPVINALCAILEEEPDLAEDGAALLAAFATIDLAVEFSEAQIDSRLKRQSITVSLIERLLPKLQKQLLEDA